MLQILIVEDDDSTRLMLKTYICDHRNQRNCDEASTLSQAIDLVAKKRYDIILLDIWLKGDMGNQLIDWARERWPDHPPLVIVMSAMSGAKEIAERHRASRFVAKPFGLEILDEIIEMNS